MQPDSHASPLRHSEFDIPWQALTPPQEFSALPPPGSHRASPKTVSGRTSYLRVRLEFLRYPHLIPTLFNGCGSGPPAPFTASSAWTWVGHPVSGLRVLTFALFRLGFPSAPCLLALSLPAPAARRTVLQKVRGYTYAVLPQFVGTGFQVLFHSPPGVLFTFPSQYFALSVTKWYLALRGGPRLFRQGFSCPGVLWIPSLWPLLRLRGSHPLWLAFPKPFFCNAFELMMVRTPQCTHCGLGSSGFARRYSRNRCFFLFLRLLRCFSSPGSPPYVMDSRMDTRGFHVWVSPFRHPRINRHVPLPAAFRSLSRLSSALSAKASALCPFLLDLAVFVVPILHSRFNHVTFL